MRKFDNLWRRLERLEPRKRKVNLLFGDPAQYAQLLDIVWTDPEYIAVWGDEVDDNGPYVAEWKENKTGSDL